MPASALAHSPTIKMNSARLSGIIADRIARNRGVDGLSASTAVDQTREVLAGRGKPTWRCRIIAPGTRRGKAR